MSRFLQSYLSNYTSGHSDARKMEEMFNNPGKYSYQDFVNQIDKAKYIPQYGDFLGNSDDDEYNERRADEGYSKANSTYLGVRSNLLNEFLSKNQASKSSQSSSTSSSPSSPKPKLPVLTGGRGDNGGSSATPGSDADPTRYMGMTPAEYEDFIDKREYEQQLGLGNQDARSRALIQDLRNQSAAEVASITSAATMYGDDRRLDIADVTSRRDKEARMYVADVQGQATTDKAKIDGAFGVKMQNIIARGAEDVEKIRGEYGLAGQQIAGEYGLERDRIQGATARDVANRNRDAQIFGSLMSGFWS